MLYVARYMLFHHGVARDADRTGPAFDVENTRSILYAWPRFINFSLHVISFPVQIYLCISRGAPLQPPRWLLCRGQMSAEEVRLLMWQMLHALKYLHALNVWHRDIKSSNVMLGIKEGHKMVKVAAMLHPTFHVGFDYLVMPTTNLALPLHI